MGGSWFAHGSNEVRELSFLFCGRQNCKPGEAVGPAVREHYLVHYCLSGRGVYRAQGVKYEIGPGEGFLILPGELTSYQADAQEPWSLIWVGFTGSRAADYLQCCGLKKDRCTFQCPQSQQLEACVDAMLEFDTAGAGNELLLLGELYVFLGWIAQSAQSSARRSREIAAEYVELAMEYIRSHFQEDLTVAKLARYVGLNRSYLTTVFQNTINMSPQQYLMRFRMEWAAKMLCEDKLTVGEIARSCGYPDPLTFSKAFKRTLGVTPTQYRRENEPQLQDGQ
ncbi:AraC family transcriptional regulator [Pseudoflavonifractor phocaeensis]|uniref:AraC family transcriptional regulator n=1 Tax=Pseudoflavonifractor phocaeensis TaxID=1870988 RepID=UPI0025A449D6|nr:AraC family transcriptional regulator [Pseudoflavonifractor phocaeensis]MDM8238503.1 AraC family transcriptional regulator [Pseudoflavonifractor phocaeensis]